MVSCLQRPGLFLAFAAAAGIDEFLSSDLEAVADAGVAVNEYEEFGIVSGSARMLCVERR